MKLFVGNLSKDATEPEVRELFSPYEPVLELHRPRDRETGSPRGFAFVTLADREVGEKAIEALNDLEFAGRKLSVNEAEDRGFRRPAPRIHEEDDITSGKTKPVDDRPTDRHGKKVRYKSI